MMTVNEIKQEICNLNITEKLLLVEEIWDVIALNQNDLPISNAQKQQLDERYKEYQAGNVSLHDYQDVHNELIAKYK